MASAETATRLFTPNSKAKNGQLIDFRYINGKPGIVGPASLVATGLIYGDSWLMQ